MFSSTQASLHLKTAPTPGQRPPWDGVHPRTGSSLGQRPPRDSVHPGTASAPGQAPAWDGVHPGMAWAAISSVSFLGGWHQWKAEPARQP